MLTEKVWERKYSWDAQFLSEHPKVMSWMILRDREQDDVDRHECRVWLSDINWPEVKKMPKVLFGLPTTYVSDNASYGVTADRILRKNFMSIRQKVAFGVLASLLRSGT